MAYLTPKSEKIKAYLTRLQYPTGKKSYQLAAAVGIKPVTFSLVSGRLDELTGQQIAKLANELGQRPGEFLEELIKLRAEETV